MTETLHILGIGKPVSRIVLGTWAIGRAMREGSDDAECIATIHHAVEHSINLIDTALVHWVERSEEGEGAGRAARDWSEP
ncbi:aldo/keto reductase [Pandoraea communis]|uniref:aldo/keto reductase n=1 Tax=Pandoraea communis TaxID=2508297 RepID=UPI0025A5DCD4|nr:aldo/keto reductase [Pandoraea communis]MDM8357705.1 aldo/keto reductase [Pandoraea communis]